MFTIVALRFFQVLSNLEDYLHLVKSVLSAFQEETSALILLLVEVI